MKKISFPGDPDFKYLDDEEKELIESIESALDDPNLTEIVTGSEFQQFKSNAQVMATNTLAKSERVNIRLSRGTLGLVKDQANKLGLPYQTLMASVLHQYATGQLKQSN